jgi:hypothetical protein
MKVMNCIKLLGVVIVIAVLTQNAMALPYSTYGYENSWQGYKNYNDNGIKMTLVFNVYDTVANPTEFTWNGGIVKPAEDRYIYAYQIINDSTSQDISLFSLLDKSKNPISQQLMHCSSAQSDGSALSVSPSPRVCDEQGIWEWSAVSGSLLSAGKNSWYLIFSSGNAPTKGDFKVEAASETDPPIPEVPEPCTLVLFSVASALFAAKRGRKRQVV